MGSPHHTLPTHARCYPTATLLPFAAGLGPHHAISTSFADLPSLCLSRLPLPAVTSQLFLIANKPETSTTTIFSSNCANAACTRARAGRRRLCAHSPSPSPSPLCAPQHMLRCRRTEAILPAYTLLADLPCDVLGGRVRHLFTLWLCLPCIFPIVWATTQEEQTNM